MAERQAAAEGATKHEQPMPQTNSEASRGTAARLPQTNGNAAGRSEQSTVVPLDLPRLLRWELVAAYTGGGLHWWRPTLVAALGPVVACTLTCVS